VATPNLSFLNQSAELVAPRLLGCLLVRELQGHTLIGRIVETEAYDQTDLASHSYMGKTERTAVMFGPAGFLYVYFTYGMHYCCNVVVGTEGEGAAVLIRGIEPVEGREFMQAHRGNQRGHNITNGPAKLCQALRIDTSMNGHSLLEGPLRIIEQPPLSKNSIVQTTRIGISQAIDVPWRFYEKGNPFVSKP
jgi:DNA-3-methyladenine glycosylase